MIGNFNLYAQENCMNKLKLLNAELDNSNSRKSDHTSKNEEFLNLLKDRGFSPYSAKKTIELLNEKYPQKFKTMEAEELLVHLDFLLQDLGFSLLEVRDLSLLATTDINDLRAKFLFFEDLSQASNSQALRLKNLKIKNKLILYTKAEFLAPFFISLGLKQPREILEYINYSVLFDRQYMLFESSVRSKH